MNSEGNVTFDGTLLRREELLTAPASGSACVHWRLKIIEPLDARLQFVHEVTAPDGFDLAWPRPDDLGARDSSPEHPPRLRRLMPPEDPGHTLRIRVVPESLRIAATPVLHRPGSPGALRVAHQFGLSSAIAVEEIVLGEGEPVSAQGFLEGGGLGQQRGPFRDVATDIELHEAALVLTQRREIGPALLPWALGAAAALFGSVGVATWAGWHFGLTAHRRDASAAQLGLSPKIPPGISPRISPTIGPPAPYSRKHFSRPD